MPSRGKNTDGRLDIIDAVDRFSFDSFHNGVCLYPYPGSEYDPRICQQAQTKAGTKMKLLYRVLIMTVTLPVFYLALWFDILDANTAGGLWLFSLMVGTMINIIFWNAGKKSLITEQRKKPHDPATL